MNRPALLILTLSSLLLWGCDVTWSEDSAYDYAIFSETGESVAMVFQTYEKKNKMKYIAKRNFKTQVVVQNDDGSKTVLSELAEGNVQDFFQDGVLRRDWFNSFIPLKKDVQTAISEFKEHRGVHLPFLCCFRIPSDEFVNNILSRELQLASRVHGFV